MKPNSILPASSLATFFSAIICACNAASYSTNSFADAFATTGPGGGLSVSNFGGAGALAVAAGGLPQGEFQSVLRFGLSGARTSFDAQFGPGSWTLQSVTLQLTAAPHNNLIFNDIAAGQFNVSLMQNNSWVEGTGNGGAPTSDGISFNSLQSTFINNAADQALGTFSFGGGNSGANSYVLNLSSGLIADILGGSDLSLRLYAADNDVSYLFNSRTGGSSANHPALIITAVPEPGSLALWVLGALVTFLPRRRFWS